MDGNSFAAWVGGVTGLGLLTKQGYDIFRNKRKERTAVQEALERQPLIKQQLEIGNVGEAVKHLNVIIATQARALDDESRRTERALERADNLEDELRECERTVEAQAITIRNQERRIRGLEDLVSPEEG